MSTDNKKTYLSRGQILDRLPLSVRISRFFESLYIFFGLYVVSLFSFDPYDAARTSQFNVISPVHKPGTRPRWGGGGGSYGSGGGGGGGGGGRRIGRIDDVRGPECGSCQ